MVKYSKCRHTCFVSVEHYCLRPGMMKTVEFATVGQPYHGAAAARAEVANQVRNVVSRTMERGISALYIKLRSIRKAFRIRGPTSEPEPDLRLANSGS